MVVKTGYFFSQSDLLLLVDGVGENVLDMKRSSLDTLAELVDIRAAHICNLVGF